MSLERALELAERGRGTTHPNPIVGAVVVAGRRGRRRGLARADGRPHARGRRARGGGRAGARRDALRDDGAVRAPRDDAAVRRRGRSRPGSRGSSPGRATRTRRPAAGSSGCARPGVEVELGGPLRGARAQNEAWRTWVARGRPFVTYKVAVTLDGRVDRAGRALGHRRGEPPARARAARRLGRRRGRDGHGARRRPAARRARRRRRRGSRAGSRSAAARCPRAPSSSCAPGRSRTSSRALAAEGVQSLLLEGGPTLATRVPRGRPRRQAARSSSRRRSPATGRTLRSRRASR